jgi:glycerol-3-phosphate dehydrogenase
MKPRNFSAVAGHVFDIIIIGGGIVGAGIARDASMRGLSVLLLEKNDFGCGTTSRSSRLIHGGLRYLRQLNFKLVRQDMVERETLLRIAPHLVHSLPFIIPLRESQYISRLALPIGLRFYDLLAMGKSLPSCRYFTKNETLKQEQSLEEVEGLVGSYQYYDCQAEYVERLCLENILSAEKNGSIALNHCRVTGLNVNGSAVDGVTVRDELGGEQFNTRAKIVVNAAGPWADTIWKELNKNPTNLRCTKGVHLFADKLSDKALVLFAHSDGRLFFVIPWKGYSLIGTTDTDYSGDPDAVGAETMDVQYLTTELKHYFPQFKESNIHYTQAGLRALAASGKNASDTSRAHKLIDFEKKSDITGFVSILGGKITAYRGIAEETTELLCRKLGNNRKCNTADTPLPGAPPPGRKIENVPEIPQEVFDNLVGLYGLCAADILDLVKQDARLGERLSEAYPDIRAQVKFAVQHEHALTVEDYIARRSNMGMQPGQGMEAVEAVAQEMAGLLNWSADEIRSQVEAYRKSVILSREYLIK